METLPNENPAQAQPLRQFPNKIVIIVASVIVVFIIGIGIVIMTSKKTPSTTPPITDIISQTPQNTSPINLALKKEPLAIVADVVARIDTRQYRHVLPYFFIDQANGLKEEQVITMLTQDRQGLTDKNGYNPRTSSQWVMVRGTQAQVLVQYAVNGKLLTARYDMQQINGVWKIMTITYNKPLDLLTVIKKQEEAKQVLEKASYATSATTFPLPNGDKVIIDRTSITVGYDHDIFVHTDNFKTGYVIAIYDAPHVRTIEYVQPGETGENAIHTFDYRDIEEKGGGLILFYPAGTEVSLTNSGNPPGALLQIPIKIEKR